MARPTRHHGKWRVRWTDATGRRRSETHETETQAEAALRRHQFVASEIRAGRWRPELVPHDFRALAQRWMEDRASQKRSARCDESMIRAHLMGAFGDLQLIQITGPRVSELSRQMNRSPKTVRNVLTLLGSMLRYAIELGWLDRLPVIRKPRVPIASQDFRYLQNQDEIRRFLVAARDEGEPVFALYATALYTGMRAGELAGLRWEDVDLERRLILVRSSYDGPTKNGESRYVPILDPLLPVLRPWRLRQEGPLVFTNRNGQMLGRSGRVFQEVLHRVLEAADFPRSERRGRLRHHITFHDLRHTFASQWMMHGGDLFKLQKILGHKSVQMTLRYAHLDPAAFASDHAIFGSGPALSAPADVVPLRGESTKRRNSDGSGKDRR